MVTDSWTEILDWNTPAGAALRKLTASLPPDRSFRITLFGSAPLQMSIEPSLLSGDVDLFADQEIGEFVKRAGLDREHSDFHVQVCSELNFRTSPRWQGRVKAVAVQNCVVVFPHPIDILIAKLNRADEKDVEAFRVVIRRTGHPTEAELIEELQAAVDLFRPGFDEEQGHDMVAACRRLWPLVFGREIDPRQEIISPALARRRAGYGEPARDYKQELREAVAGLG